MARAVVFVALLLLPLASASGPDIDVDSGEPAHECWGYEGSWWNVTWERFDGPRYYNQTGSEGWCRSSHATGASVSQDGEAVVAVQGEHEAENISEQREVHAGTAAWERVDDERWQSRESRSSSHHRASFAVDAAGARVGGEQACDESASEEASRFWSNGTWQDGPSHYGHRTETTEQSRDCQDRVAADAEGQSAAYGRSDVCRTSYHEDEVDQDYHWNGHHDLTYIDTSASEECEDRRVVTVADTTLVAWGESASCGSEMHYRDAWWDGPEYDVDNEIWDNSSSCARMTSIEVATLASVRQGSRAEETSWCYAETTHSYCFVDGSSANGTWVDGPAGASLFLGREESHHHSCNESVHFPRGCQGTEHTFEGARFTWEGSPAGPVVMEQPTDLP